MLRTLWVGLNIALATLVFGLVVLVAALFRHRGGLYAWATQEWGRAVLWAAGVPVYLEGSARVDWGRPLVLVSNHASGWDIFAIAAVLPRPFSFVGKKELDRIPFFGAAWRAAGHISIDRSDRQKAIQSLNRAGAKIRAENSTVVIFPEGTRSRDGELRPFKKGAFMLALQAGVPVVPAVVLGSTEILPRGSWRVRRRPIVVRIGAPVETGAYARTEAELLMDVVRDRMGEMRAAERPEPMRAR